MHDIKWCWSISYSLNRGERNLPRKRNKASSRNCKHLKVVVDDNKTGVGFMECSQCGAFLSSYGFNFVLCPLIRDRATSLVNQERLRLELYFYFHIRIIQIHLVIPEVHCIKFTLGMSLSSKSLTKSHMVPLMSMKFIELIQGLNIREKN